MCKNTINRKSKGKKKKIKEKRKIKKVKNEGKSKKIYMKNHSSLADLRKVAPKKKQEKLKL